ncbi:restriction endonuclease subunit S [Kribbella sp. NPDC050124]|uniref:restriction endonuclease subunit S n=1 Tax=Kribbella sp. NPDC050124 TaxID=3364114 RepID=UPI0037BA0D69
MTMHVGLVDQSVKFKKRVASDDVSDYKVISRGQLVVGFPIDEGVLDFQTLYDEGIVSPAYGVWDLADEELVHRPYLKKFLRSNPALAYYKGKLRGSTARRRSLPAEVFLALPVPLPTLASQRRIAAILDQVDAIRAKRRDVLANLDALPQSIFHDMFGDPVDNPKGWSMRHLGDEAHSMQYGPRFHNESYSEHGVRIVRITDLNQSGQLNFDGMPRMSVTDEERRKFELSPGDIVFARTGATVGKLAIIRDIDPPSIAGAYFIRIQVSRNVLPEFVAAVLRSRSVQSIIWVKSHQSAQQNFSGPGLRALPLPIPPLGLQREFVDRTESVRGARARFRADSFGELFAALQSRAFQGEL